jgi:CSLREA domain-containing protein
MRTHTLPSPNRARRWRWSLICILALVAATSVLAVPRVYAANLNLTVDSFDDEPDRDPGDGKCDSRLVLNRCTLRAATMEANATLGTHTINVPAGTYTLTLTDFGLSDATGPLTLRRNATIRASGGDVTIRGTSGWNHRLMYIDPNVVAELRGIIMRDSAGGAIQIVNGRLTLNLSTITNVTDSSDGGAIHQSGGTLTITNSILRNNVSGRDGGAIYRMSGDTFIDNSVIENNQAMRDGGGIFVLGGGTVDIAKTSIRNNTANKVGGGIKTTNLQMRTSLVAANRAEQGGGVHLSAASQIRNSTISGNTVLTGGSGGGLMIAGNVTTLNNVTIASNAGGTSGGGLFIQAGTVRLGNTIIADNTAGNSPDCRASSGAITLIAPNIIANGSGCIITQSATAPAQIGVDPDLGALFSNGGPTHTHALPPTSPAIDAGSAATPGSTTTGACEATDQRGRVRPEDGDNSGTVRCDIGAYERINSVVLGVASLTPDAAVVDAGEQVALTATWTVPEPMVWRDLAMVELRLTGADGSVVRAGFDEAAGTLGFNETLEGDATGTASPGSEGVLEGALATLHLGESRVQGSGPTGVQVTMVFVLSFRSVQEGQSYTISLFARGDDGREELSETLGLLRVEPRTNEE